MKSFVLLLTAVSLAHASAAGSFEPAGYSRSHHWLHMHPGGGGQIQGITADPNVPGRLYTCSDVEGLYRSDDWGATWRSLGRTIIHHMVFHVAVDPRDSNVLYAGTLYGLSKSIDGGASWSTLVGGYANASFAFDPHDPDTFIAGHSWYIKDTQLTSQTEQPDQVPEGERFVLISRDAGRTFAKVIYETTPGYKQVYAIAYDATRRGHVYLGAHSGLYRSDDSGASFVRLKGPSGLPIDAGTCGATLTPDGRFVIAAFGQVNGRRFAGGTRYYACAVDALRATDEAGESAWHALDDGLYYPPNGNNQYWNPKVDPRSLRPEYGLAGTYKILASFLNGPIGPLAAHQGLHEGTFHEEAGRLVGRFSRIFARPDVSPEWTFDLGWNTIGPQNRQNTYLPLSWDNAPAPAHLEAAPGPRRVYITNNQQLYLGDADRPHASWSVLSNRFIRTLNGHRFYRTPGFASTVNYDMDAVGDYWIQGMADNGLMESYDDGYAWGHSSAVANVNAMANGDAVLVVRPRPGREEAPLLLAGTAPGFGGGAHTATGVLRARTLADPSGATADPRAWRAIAGGPNGDGGLAGGPNGGPRIWYLAAHPSSPEVVLAGTHSGLFYSDDIRALADGQGGAFRRIDEVGGTFSFGRIYLDGESPAHGWVAYTKSSAGTTRPETDASTADSEDRGVPFGTHHLQKVQRTPEGFRIETIPTPTALGGQDDFAWWRDRAGTEWMAYSDREARVFVRSRPQAQEWSDWERILDENGILAVYRAPWWNWTGYTPEGPVETRMRLTLTGLVGHEDTLAVGSYAAFGKHGYAMLRAQRRPDGAWHWHDWTGKESDPHNFMTVPRIWRARLLEPRTGEFYYAAASRGGGLIVRRIDK